MIILRKNSRIYKGNIVELNIYDRFLKGHIDNMSIESAIVVDDRQLLELYKKYRLEGEVKQYVENKLLAKKNNKNQ